MRISVDRVVELAHALFIAVPGQGLLTDDADQLVAIDDRQAAELVLGHRVQGVRDRVVGTDRHGLSIALAEIDAGGFQRVGIRRPEHANGLLAAGLHDLDAIYSGSDQNIPGRLERGGTIDGAVTVAFIDAG